MPQAMLAAVNDDDAAQEDPLVAEQVAQPSRQQQEATEGQHVGVDHPGQRGWGEAQVGLDGWQRDVHDIGVEDDHQVAEAQHVQRQPAGLLVVHGPSPAPGGLSPSRRPDLTGYDNSSQRIFLSPFLSQGVVSEASRSWCG